MLALRAGLTRRVPLFAVETDFPVRSIRNDRRQWGPTRGLKPSIRAVLNGGESNELDNVFRSKQWPHDPHATSELYDDRVPERVQQGHSLVAQFRRHGVNCSISEVNRPGEVEATVSGLASAESVSRQSSAVSAGVRDVAFSNRDSVATLVGLARREEPVRRFQELTGIGWIRVITFYAYIDTPLRFTR